MYIDEGDAASLEVIGKSVQAFAGAAAEGQFAVNEHGGEALLRSLRQMTDWIEKERNMLYILEQEPALGGSNSAKVMRPYVQQVAIDHQGFLAGLDALGRALRQAEAAIVTAMGNYRQVDEENARGIA